MSGSLLVTGASGFIGCRLVERLRLTYPKLTAVVRSGARVRADEIVVGGIHQATDWGRLLQGQQCVIHTAARTQVMHDSAVDPLAEYRQVNVEATLNLARQAAQADVKRFIFISSIKVNGEQTQPGKPFMPDDPPAPEDAYGLSKWEAEQGLQQLASETAMQVVIIRPPLVYGPGVKGNFASMMKRPDKGLPLPLGAIHNQRSLVALDNLVDLIVTCIEHPAAANQVFLAGDGQDVSTPELLRGLAEARGQSSRLIPVPASLLMLGACVVGKKAVARRLLGSLQVDISKARKLLGWQPPITVEEGLKRCFK